MQGPLARHWWASFKPWTEWPLATRMRTPHAEAPATARAYGEMIVGEDPMDLAKMVRRPRACNQ